jgi:hypothetical protein
VRVFVRDRYGPPDVLALREIPTPTPKSDEVLVRLRAASLDQADLDYLYGRPMLTRMGTGIRRPKNAGLGLDAAGEVESVGHGVTAFRPGDEVFGDLTQFGYGAFGEYACAAERAWAHKPPSMSFEEAATVPHMGAGPAVPFLGQTTEPPGYPSRQRPDDALSFSVEEMEGSSPRMVSPAWGRRAVQAMRSIIVLSTTAMRGWAPMATTVPDTPCGRVSSGRSRER